MLSLSARTLLRALLLAALLFCTCALSAYGQHAALKQPYSFTHPVADPVPTFAVPAARVQAAGAAASKAVPAAIDPMTGATQLPAASIGVPVTLGIGMDGAGTWVALADGGRLWRLRISSTGATGLALFYDAFFLPPGASLFIYNDARTTLAGPFTSRDNTPTGQFATDVLHGDAVTLEYHAPASVTEPARLHIGHLLHGEEGPHIANATAGTYTPTALSCSINTACQAGDDWQDASRASVMVVRENGAACSGVLLNNVRADGTPYVLTAHHCGRPSVGETLNWVIRFDYESPTCEDPADVPAYHSAAGVTVVAAESAGDYALLRIDGALPADFQITYAGWSRATEHAPHGVAVGHPRADLKKISFADDSLKTFGTNWDATFTRGTIEPGSSGSPLFNDAGQVIGHLLGALTLYDVCVGDNNNARIVFPKLSYTWDTGAAGARLSDFLDPDGTDTTSLGGYTTGDAPPPPPAPAAYWINEIDADAGNQLEFVEIVGAAGEALDGYQLEVYSCQAGVSTLEATHPLGPFTFTDESSGHGFYVLGGTALDAALLDATLPGDNALPDASGILVLKDDAGHEVFGYQYDGTPARCPASRPTRSAADGPDAGSMGFLEATVLGQPAETAPALNTLLASPGTTNTDEGQSLPVELVAFGAVTDGNAVSLRWETASETNNAGFEVQRRGGTVADWQALGFVEGSGTTLEARRYDYRIASLDAGHYTFRLKQIDYDGTFAYSPEVEVVIALREAYRLAPAYPNPFSGETRFALSVAREQHVTVSVYNLLGRRMLVLHDGPLPASGPRLFRFDGDGFASGVYVVRVQGERFSDQHLVTLMR